MTDFTGNKVRKTWQDSIRALVSYNWKGSGNLEIWFSAGKKGWLGDYDQESPAYKQVIPMPTTSVFVPWGSWQDIPLYFWGDRRIGDGAVEVVFKLPGRADIIIQIWDAYTVNI